MRIKFLLLIAISFQLEAAEQWYQLESYPQNIKEIITDCSQLVTSLSRKPLLVGIHRSKKKLKCTHFDDTQIVSLIHNNAYHYLPAGYSTYVAGHSENYLQMWCDVTKDNQDFIECEQSVLHDAYTNVIEHIKTGWYPLLCKPDCIMFEKKKSLQVPDEIKLMRFLIGKFRLDEWVGIYEAHTLQERCAYENCLYLTVKNEKIGTFQACFELRSIRRSLDKMQQQTGIKWLPTLFE